MCSASSLINIYRKVLVIFGVVLGFSSYAQSSLPPCQDNILSKWNNCFGVASFVNGETYVGEWANGKYSGKGAFTFKNGNKYDGFFKEGRYDGQGTTNYGNGEKYTGGFKEGVYSGQGTLTYVDGSKYIGEFKNGMRNGQGSLIALGGVITHKGLWADNEFVRGERINVPTNTIVASECDQVQKIKFRDGSEGCMSEFELFKFSFSGLPAGIQSYVVDQKRYAVAITKDLQACPAAHIGWATTESAAKRNCDSFLIDGAKKLNLNLASCQCESIIENGSTRLTKNDLNKKSNAFFTTRSANLNRQNVVTAAASVPNKTVNSGSAQTAKSVYALVIGNGRYNKASLINPTNDANEIARRFTQYGFTVRLVLDGDRRALIRALNDFQMQSVNYETNILFYAGHGIQYNGINYIIPTDMSLEAGSASIDFDAISTNQIVDKYMRGKTKLVFLDACRDNPLARSFMASRGVGSVSKGLAPMDVASGTLISYATKDGNVAIDGDGKNSPYTEALLKHLDSREDISLILRKVRQDVMNKTKGKQVPWDYGSLVGGQLILSNK